MCYASPEVEEAAPVVSMLEQTVEAAVQAAEFTVALAFLLPFSDQQNP
jgi:hypothetical protein